MSRTIDEKVVEMRFDNQDFEKNVSQSMSTLDKLKSALNFSGVEKTFSDITSASHKLDFSGASAAIETVGEKFSWLETLATGALLNIGSQIEQKLVNTLKSVTIDQVSAGFDKYADKTKAVQTIMSATGKEIEEVSEQLERLNWYTDETSYSFEDMVSNIGKFTANGVELSEAVTAMEGISNWAAISGQGKNEAARAMYNLSQALSSGSVMVKDWMSIENASMATKEFKELAIQAAVTEGTLKKFYDDETGEEFYATYQLNDLGEAVADVEVDWKNFRETLKEKWFTDTTLVNVLNQYGGFADELGKVYDELSETSDITTSQIIKLTNQYVDGTLDMEQAMLMTGKSAEELEGILAHLGSEEYALGRKAFAAAQEAKTFEDAIEATKDAVSTQLMTSFEILFGNYEEAKVLWTDLANELWEIFAGPISNINDVLLGWKNLGGRDEFINGVKDIYHALRSIVDPITEAWEKIFAPTDSKGLYEITKGFHEFTNGLILSEENMEKLGSIFESIFKAVGLVKDVIGDLVGSFLSPLIGQISNIGGGIFDIFTEAAGRLGNFISTIYRVSNLMEYYDGTLSGFFENIREAVKNGEISVATLHNVLTAGPSEGLLKILDIFNKIKDSLGIIATLVGQVLNVSSAMSKFEAAGGGIAGVFAVVVDRIKLAIYSVQELIRTWTGLNTKNIFEPVLKGLFSFRDTLADLQKWGWFDLLKDRLGLIGTAIRETFGGMKEFLAPVSEAFQRIITDFGKGIGILLGDGAANLDTFLGHFDDLLISIAEFIRTSEKLKGFVDTIKEIIAVTAEFAAEFLSLSDTIETFKEAGGGLSGVFAVIQEKIEIVLDYIFDLIQAITGLDLHNVGDTLGKIFGGVTGFIVKAIEKVKEFFSLFKKENRTDYEQFGEESGKKFEPLMKFFEGLKKLFSGIWAGLSKLKPVVDAVFGKVGEVLGVVGDSLKEAVGNLDIDKVMGIIDKAFKVGLGYGIVNFVNSLRDPLDGLKSVFAPVLDILDGIKGALEAWQRDLQAKTLLKIAAAIGIITVAVIALSGVESSKITASLGAVAAMIGELMAAMYAEGKLVGATDAKKLNSTAMVMIEMSVAVLIMASALKKMSEIDGERLGASIGAMTAAIGELSGASIAIGKLGGGAGAGAGFAMIEMALALLLVASTLDKISKIDSERLLDSIGAVTAAIAEMTLANIAIGKFGGASVGSGLAMIEMATSLLIVASTLKKISEIDSDKLLDSIGVMTAVVAEMTLAMIAIGQFGGASVGNGLAMIEMATSLLIVAGVLKKIGELTWEEIAKGLVGMTAAIVEMTGAIILIGQFGGMSVGTGLAMIEMAASLSIVAGVLKKLGELSWEEIGKGLIAMGVALVEMTLSLIALGSTAPLALAGALAMIAMAGALAILAPVLKSLGEMTWEEMVKSLLMLAGAFAVIGVAGLVLGPITPLIVALAAAIALLGVGVVGVGAGLLMFAAAMTAFSAAGTVGIELLVFAIKSIISLIPFLITKVGEGIMAIIKMVGENAVTIAETVTSVLSAILDAAVTLIPKIVDVAFTIITKVLETIANNAGSIIDSVATIMLELLRGITEYLPQFIQAGVDLVLSLVEGLGDGLIDNAERARNAFKDLFEDIIAAILVFLGVDKEEASKFAQLAGDMISNLATGIAKFAMKAIEAIGKFIEDIIDKIKEYFPKFVEKGGEILTNIKDGFLGMVETVKKAFTGALDTILGGGEEVIEKGKEIGGNLASGIKNGIQNFGSKVVDAATGLGNKVLNAFDTVFDSHSPSRETEKDGENLDTGLADGEEEYAHIPIDAAGDVAEKVLNEFGKYVNEENFEELSLDALSSFADGYASGSDDVLSQVQMSTDDISEVYKDSIAEHEIDGYEAGSGYGSATVDGFADTVLNSLEEVKPTLVTAFEEVGSEIGDEMGRTLVDKFNNQIGTIDYEEGTLTPVFDFGNLKMQADEYDAYMGIFRNASKEDQDRMIREMGADYQNDGLANYMRQIQLEDQERWTPDSIKDQSWQNMAAEIAQQTAEISSLHEENRAYREESWITDGDGNVLSYNEATWLELKKLNDNVNELNDNMQNQQIVLDSGELVGATTPKYDRSFGNKTILSKRGI